MLIKNEQGRGLSEVVFQSQAWMHRIHGSISHQTVEGQICHLLFTSRPLEPVTGRYQRLLRCNQSENVSVSVLCVSHSGQRHPPAAGSEGRAWSGSQRRRSRCPRPSSAPPTMHRGGTGRSHDARGTTQRLRKETKLMFELIELPPLPLPSSSQVSGPVPDSER